MLFSLGLPQRSLRAFSRGESDKTNRPSLGKSSTLGIAQAQSPLGVGIKNGVTAMSAVRARGMQHFSSCTSLQQRDFASAEATKGREPRWQLSERPLETFGRVLPKGLMPLENLLSYARWSFARPGDRHVAPGDAPRRTVRHCMRELPSR